MQFLSNLEHVVSFMIFHERICDCFFLQRWCLQIYPTFLSITFEWQIAIDPHFVYLCDCSFTYRQFFGSNFGLTEIIHPSFLLKIIIVAIWLLITTNAGKRGPIFRSFEDYLSIHLHQRRSETIYVHWINSIANFQMERKVCSIIWIQFEVRLELLVCFEFSRLKGPLDRISCLHYLNQQGPHLYQMTSTFNGHFLNLIALFYPIFLLILVCSSIILRDFVHLDCSFCDHDSNLVWQNFMTLSKEKILQETATQFDFFVDFCAHFKGASLGLSGPAFSRVPRKRHQILLLCLEKDEAVRQNLVWYLSPQTYRCSSLLPFSNPRGSPLHWKCLQLPFETQQLTNYLVALICHY